MPEVLTIESVIEVESVARELANAYRRRIEIYRDQLNVADPVAYAEALARERSPEARRRAETAEPNQVSYLDLEDLVEVDPAATLAAWHRMKAAAGDELRSGHRAGRAMEFQGGPWERAQFLAIRTAFIEQWQPQNGGEQLLVDMLAQTYASYLDWLAQLQVYTLGEASTQRHHIKEHGRYETPRLSTGAAMDQAAAMVDRFNRLFLRTLRQLRDLRRYGQQIVINSPGQVNIGQQQVNATLHQDPV